MLDREQILNMKAGPALDALIATEVLKLSARTSSGKYGESTLWYTASGELVGKCPCSSTDIAAAMRALGAVRHASNKEGSAIWVNLQRVGASDDWWVEFHGYVDRGKKIVMEMLYSTPHKHDTTCSLPLAICRAALLTTLEEKVEEKS